MVKLETISILVQSMCPNRWYYINTNIFKEHETTILFIVTPSLNSTICKVDMNYDGKQ